MRVELGLAEKLLLAVFARTAVQHPWFAVVCFVVRALLPGIPSGRGKCVQSSKQVRASRSAKRAETMDERELRHEAAYIDAHLLESIP